MTSKLIQICAVGLSLAWMLIGGLIYMFSPFPLHVGIIGYAVWILLIVCAWLLWLMWDDHRASR